VTELYHLRINLVARLVPPNVILEVEQSLRFSKAIPTALDKTFE
jgi:hypothetical protein